MGEHERTQISKSQRWLRLGIRLGSLLGGLWLWIAFAPWFWQGFAPFCFAFGLAYLLNPTVERWSQSMGLRRSLVTLALLGFFLLGTCALLWLILPALYQELVTLNETWDALFRSGQEAIDGFEAVLANLLQVLPTSLVTATLDQGLEMVKTALGTWLTDLLGHLGQQAATIPHFFLAFFVSLMATYFLSAEFPQILGKAKANCSGKTLRLASTLRHSALTAFGGYLRAQLLLSFGVFFLLLVGFLFFQIPFALLLAFAIALVDFIPMIGAGLILLPWAGIAYFAGDHSLGWELLLIWVVVSLFRRFAEPKILGEQTGLSSLLSLVSLYVGLQWWGVWGMIFAPILLMMLLAWLELGLLKSFRSDLAWGWRELGRVFR